MSSIKESNTVVATDETCSEDAPDVALAANLQAAQHMASVRLGRREREVLLGAAPYGTPTGARAVPSGTPRASQEASLRAVRRLRALGLVDTNRENCGPYGRFVWRTALGEAVLAAHGDELRAGRPIRWGAP